MADPAHEVIVPCDCGNIEQCRMELYVSDVRIAYAKVERTRSAELIPKIGAEFALEWIERERVGVRCQEAERDDRHGLARL